MVLNVMFFFQKEDFLFNSFDEPCIAAMKKIDPDMRCALGLPTKKLFGEVGLNWVPIKDEYQSEAVADLKIISEKYGIDIVTSDLKEDVLGPLCKEKRTPINLAINALRVKQEAVNHKLPDAEWSELEREKKEVLKLVEFAEKYGVQIYYKSDNPGKIKEFVLQLAAQKEKQLKVKVEPSVPQSGKEFKKETDVYDPRLISTQRKSGKNDDNFDEKNKSNINPTKGSSTID